MPFSIALELSIFHNNFSTKSVKSLKTKSILIDHFFNRFLFQTVSTYVCIWCWILFTDQTVVESQSVESLLTGETAGEKEPGFGEIFPFYIYFTAIDSSRLCWFWFFLLLHESVSLDSNQRPLAVELRVVAWMT